MNVDINVVYELENPKTGEDILINASGALDMKTGEIVELYFEDDKYDLSSKKLPNKDKNFSLCYASIEYQDYSIEFSILHDKNGPYVEKTELDSVADKLKKKMLSSKKMKA